MDHALTGVGRCRFIRYFRDGQSEEYYDLVADPDERHNLLDAAAHAAAVHQLRERLDHIVKRRWELHDEALSPCPSPKLGGGVARISEPG